MARSKKSVVAEVMTHEDIFSHQHNCSADPTFLKLITGGVHHPVDLTHVRHFDLDYNTPNDEVLEGGIRKSENISSLARNNRIVSIDTVAELMLRQEKGGNGPLATNGCTNLLYAKVGRDTVMGLLRWQLGTFSWHIKHKPADQYHLIGSRTRVFYVL